VILFGGWGNTSERNDTWAYDYAANAWVDRNPANPPPARDAHAMAYDSQSGKMIVFGGYRGSFRSDTWAYDYTANTWTNRSPANHPSARDVYGMAYDSQSGKVILFGGVDKIPGDVLNDTWAYDDGGEVVLSLSLVSPNGTYQVPYLSVRDGVQFAGSYASDLSTAYIKAYSFTNEPRFTLELMVQRHHLTYLSMLYFGAASNNQVQQFLYVKSPTWIPADEGQASGIRLDTLDDQAHAFFGQLLWRFWPASVPFEEDPLWPLIMLFSPLTG
jgi:hypothetical protein